MSEQQDIVIIGAGVTGVAIARALTLKHPGLKVTVLEKENQVATHASGRNSGVLHAGFNQKPGSLKAKLCVEGNRAIREFAAQHGVQVKPVGTLVVALSQDELPVLDEILRRGQANGVPDLRVLDRAALLRLEPNARGLAALNAPTGAIVDNNALVSALATQAKERGVAFLFHQHVTAIEEGAGGYRVVSENSEGRQIHHGRFVINAAGLYADKIAHMLDAGRQYQIVPFRGEYYNIKPRKSSLVNSMIYPVPNLKYPFLGVHWTKKLTVALPWVPTPSSPLGGNRTTGAISSRRNLFPC